MYSYTVRRLTTGGSESVVTTINTKGPLTAAEAATRADAYVVRGVAAIITDDSGESGWGTYRLPIPAVASYYDEDHESFKHLDEGPVAGGTR